MAAERKLFSRSDLAEIFLNTNNPANQNVKNFWETKRGVQWRKWKTRQHWLKALDSLHWATYDKEMDSRRIVIVEGPGIIRWGYRIKGMCTIQEGYHLQAKHQQQQGLPIWECQHQQQGLPIWEEQNVAENSLLPIGGPPWPSPDMGSTIGKGDAVPIGLLHM